MLEPGETSSLIDVRGIPPHHRKSFCRISDLLLELQHQTELDDLERQALDDVGIPDEDELEDGMIADAEIDSELEDEIIADGDRDPSRPNPGMEQRL